ncbi:pH-response regulator protein palF/RIM8 [Venturia nashicola]|uniref:pH-response regulator protein palF/RIM8 n=1 Tax=Venturia nashicola TaxID=86259 RepID=A0A4Z1NHF3_9PEZI|nr:pH-response regulator protein palF/RIM8 [Venturia nashicola]TLD21027.1 pH-response regulator protein palF/RIM8 [Venturia nashicola]
MCHIHRIWYSCSHGDLVLRSKCRATRIKLTRRRSTNLPHEEGYAWTPVYTQADTPFYQLAACKAHSTLEINLKTRCGPCRFDAVKKKWDREMAMTRAGASMMGARGTALDELLAELKEQRANEEWGCRKMYPPEGKRGPITKVQLRVKGDRSDSPLRNELQPDDIEDVDEVNWNDLMRDLDKPVVEGEVDGGTFMDFFEDRYGFWGPSVEFTDADIDISSLQISDMEAKGESLNDSGYSSAEPDQADEEISEEITWEFETPDAPTFPPDEDEAGWDDGGNINTKDEGLFQDELAVVCTFAEMNDKTSGLLAHEMHAKMDLIVW